MRTHDGYKRVFKIDGLKGRARRAYHKAVRQRGKALCRDRGE